MNPQPPQPSQPQPAPRKKPWEKPAIVLERALVVRAQEGGAWGVTGEMPIGIVGTLSASGEMGTCGGM